MRPLIRPTRSSPRALPRRRTKPCPSTRRDEPVETCVQAFHQRDPHESTLDGVPAFLTREPPSPVLRLLVRDLRVVRAAGVMNPQIGQNGRAEADLLEVGDVLLVLEPEDLLRFSRKPPARWLSSREVMAQPPPVGPTRRSPRSPRQGCTRAGECGAGTATPHREDRPRDRRRGIRPREAAMNASSRVLSQSCGASSRRRRSRSDTATCRAGMRGRRRSDRCSLRCGRPECGDPRATRGIRRPVRRGVVPDEDLPRVLELVPKSTFSTQLRSRCTRSCVSTTTAMPPSDWVETFSVTPGS